MQDGSSPTIVAIDGPAGAGKSTIARLLAQRLGYTYIDTGAMYRAVALCSERQGISWDDPDGLERLTLSLDLEFEPDGERSRLLVNGEDVSEAIRTPQISRGASEVSRWPGVRCALVEQQQRMSAEQSVVMEGRDIGTVVFPQAQVKIFLTATPEERSRRRTAELSERGEEADPEQVLQEVLDRDRRDCEREHSPLRQAEDAMEVVTDGMSIDEVVEHLARLAEGRAKA